MFFSLLLASALVFWACEPPDNFTVKSYFKDATTFIIMAKGNPMPDKKDNLQRQYTAERAALLVAQNEMVKKLKAYKIESETVIDTQYDDQQNCLLTYQVIVKPK